MFKLCVMNVARDATLRRNTFNWDFGMCRSQVREQSSPFSTGSDMHES